MLSNIGLPGLILIIGLFVNVVAFWKLLPRAGLSSWLALLAIVPVIAFVLLWIVAFKEWPEDK